MTWLATAPAGPAPGFESPGVADFDLFFSHCHFDHIIGLPFLHPLYKPHVSARIHAGLSLHLEQPRVIVGEAELASGAEHAFAFHASQAGLLYGKRRQGCANSGERRLHADAHVRRSADDL